MTEEYPDFGTFYASLFLYYQAGDYAGALERASEAQPHYPDDQALLYHFRACMAAKMDDADRALALLREALDKGYWYSQVYWDDQDFASLRDLDEFKRLRNVSEARMAAARANAQPELTVQMPETALEPLPLLMALHGNGHNGHIELPHWSPLLRRGWLIASVQSSQIVGPERYVWDNRELATHEMKQHYDDLHDEYPIEAGHFVVGGFSMGAETAIELSLRGTLPADGFIAVGPGGPLLQSPDLWDDLLTPPLPVGLRGAIVVGTADPLYDNVKAFATRLEAAGVPLRYMEYAGMGHVYPPDFEQHLLDLVAFVVTD